MSTKSKKARGKKQAPTLDYEEVWKNPMKMPYLEKIVLNIGVGSAGEELERAVQVLESIAGIKAVKTLSKTNVKEFNLRKGRPIGVKVTTRGEAAEKLLKRLIIVNNNKILRKSFDDFGNFGFGVIEHISIPGIEYESTIGIWGLDVCGRIIRPGMRVKYRRINRAKVPKYHYVNRDEAQYFLKKNYNITAVDKLELEYI